MQILKVVKEKNRLGISDHHGNVAVVDADGKVQWKRKSDGEFGWMVQQCFLLLCTSIMVHILILLFRYV